MKEINLITTEQTEEPKPLYLLKREYEDISTKLYEEFNVIDEQLSQDDRTYMSYQKKIEEINSEGPSYMASRGKAQIRKINKYIKSNLKNINHDLINQWQETLEENTKILKPLADEINAAQKIEDEAKKETNNKLKNEYLNNDLNPLIVKLKNDLEVHQIDLIGLNEPVESRVKNYGMTYENAVSMLSPVQKINIHEKQDIINLFKQILEKLETHKTQVEHMSDFDMKYEKKWIEKELANHRISRK